MRGRAVLEFDAARLDPGEGLPLFDMTFTLRPGELALVEAHDPLHERMVMDAACGLTLPVEGAVRCAGHDWRALRPDRANALRGRIGHLFRDGGWPPQMTVDAAIMLAPSHHTRRPLAEIREEAVRLAAAFGLPGLPCGLPGEHGVDDLQRAGLVRAFIGAPLLVLLESPRRGLLPDLVGPVVNAAREVRDRDGAVLWSVGESGLGRDPTLPCSQRLQLSATRMVMLEAVA